MEHYRMNIALVTGANKGIGLETSHQLAQKGMKVLMASRDAERGTIAAQQLIAEGLDVEFIHIDMENPYHFTLAAESIEQRFGHLDVLVNNAGVQIESETWATNNTESVSPEVLRTTFDINFFGMVELTQKLLPLLRKAPAARIVNVTSILASLSMHATAGSNTYNTKLLAYNSSKAAVNAFTIHLAHALKDTPIKVNAAHPGWVKTDMGGKGATLELADGAATSVALATLPADGPSGAYMFRNTTLPW
jgi:NAD(P)-dependent dehydrogenase (short-subunit alcohol dehydrogenase family)